MQSRYQGQRISQLVKRMTAVSDPQILERLAAEVLAERPIELLADLLATLGREALTERYRQLYMAVARLCLDRQEVGGEAREQIYSLLAARGESALVRYLLPLSAVRTAGDSEMPYDAEIDDMPLGVRKWKSRLHNRDLLMRLARTGDPAVIGILLGNPRVTEPDVVNWAARRPASAAALLLIARHRRWALAARVQEALARNPYTPVHVAASFMPLFPAGTLKRIRGDASLHELVREAARDILIMRRAKSEEPC